MTNDMHPQGTQRMFHSAMQSEAISRNGQRIFIVPEIRGEEWRWAAGWMRIKTALNYWRNGYKWRASWILAQR